MKAFTIDNDNNITVHASRKAARETGAPVFASEEQLADLIGPDNKRLVDIWNSLPGVTPVTKFANRTVATARIWKAVQSLGEQAAAPISEPQLDATEAAAAPPELPVATPEHADAEVARPLEDATLQAEIEPIALTDPSTSGIVEPAANVGALAPQGAPAKAKASKRATATKSAPKGKRAAKAGESAGPREGSKMAVVVAMLERKGGATLAEVMMATGWQAHSVRGFVAGALKKAGYAVTSFKSDKGERTYRINQ